MHKVLIITYYWPPAGGPGVQRWLKFVKYLRDFDIEPLVYAPENPNYPLVDTSFLQEIPQGIKVYKQKIFEPYGLAKIFSRKKTKQISSGIITTKNQSAVEKILLWIRGNLFIPDARMFWVGPSVKFLSKLIADEGINTIITTGPPHSIHLIGHRLKSGSQINWIADFRDPWTSIGYHNKLRLTAWAQKRHKRLEHLVLNEADRIIVTSARTKEEFSGLTGKPIVIITNGYDSREEKPTELDADFTVSHIGSLLSGRNPINLWKALSELIRENEDFKLKFKLQLAGVVSSDVMDSIQAYGLGPYTNVLGYLSHHDAVQFQNRSQVLLLIEIDSDETKGIIPGKVFEYMAATRPILGVGPRDWEVAALLETSNTGAVYNHQQFNELKQTLLHWFREYQNKRLSLPFANIAHYHRRELTRELAKQIKQWE
jgi:hypothetical protein